MFNALEIKCKNNTEKCSKYLKNTDSVTVLVISFSMVFNSETDCVLNPLMLLLNDLRGVCG